MTALDGLVALVRGLATAAAYLAAAAVCVCVAIGLGVQVVERVRVAVRADAIAQAKVRAFVYPPAASAPVAAHPRAGHAAPATETDFARPMGATCTVPPDGWYCTRPRGHEPPCAAWPLTRT